MKAFTDLEQSKKLAEILPIETADFHFTANLSPQGYLERRPIWGNFRDADYSAFPCWSLSALLSVIPQEIFDGEYIINITEGCDNRWVLTYDHHENRNHSYYGLSSGADNLVDACVEMIYKLKEKDLL